MKTKGLPPPTHARWRVVGGTPWQVGEGDLRRPGDGGSPRRGSRKEVEKNRAPPLSPPQGIEVKSGGRLEVTKEV